MDIQETQELFENLLLVNPDFDESLLEKDEEGSYEDSSIQDMYSMFEAGTEVGEQSKQAKKVAVPEGFVLVEKDLIQSIHQSCVSCLDIDFKPVFKAAVSTIRDSVKPLIEAQEQVG